MAEAATTIAKSSSSRALHLPTSNFQAAAVVVVVVVSFYWQSAQAFVASPWTTPSPPPLPPASPSLSSSSFLSCAAVNFVVYWLWPTISFAPRLIIHSVGRVSHLIEPCIIFGPLLAPWAKGLSVSVCSYNRAWFVIWFLVFFRGFVGRSGLSISMVIYEIWAKIRERNNLHFKWQLEMFCKHDAEQETGNIFTCDRWIISTWYMHREVVL